MSLTVTGRVCLVKNITIQPQEEDGVFISYDSISLFVPLIILFIILWATLPAMMMRTHITIVPHIITIERIIQFISPFHCLTGQEVLC